MRERSETHHRAPAKPGAAKPALVISAGKLTAQTDQQAEGSDGVELRYGELLLNTDKLTYRVVDDFARAEGNVRINHNGNVFTGPLLQMYVSRFEGEFLTPSFFLAATGGAGTAKVVLEYTLKYTAERQQFGKAIQNFGMIQKYLADIGTFAQMNKAWDAWVPVNAKPARATIEAKLAAPEYRVEIQVTALG